jgi:hypothetical protein
MGTFLTCGGRDNAMNVDVRVVVETTTVSTGITCVQAPPVRGSLNQYVKSQTMDLLDEILY